MRYFYYAVVSCDFLGNFSEYGKRSYSIDAGHSAYARRIINWFAHFSSAADSLFYGVKAGDAAYEQSLALSSGHDDEKRRGQYQKHYKAVKPRKAEPVVLCRAFHCLRLGGFHAVLQRIDPEIYLSAYFCVGRYGLYRNLDGIFVGTVMPGPERKFLLVSGAFQGVKIIDLLQRSGIGVGRGVNFV